MALIKCDGISIAYEGQTVVRDLSFWIEQGDYLCIVGENGSGKSTLVKSLLGLKPPFKGQILLGDGLKQDEIGYLPQQTVVQKDFPASVYEVVLSGSQREYGAFRNPGNGTPVLPGSFRRTETEGAAGESAVCHKEAPVVRRARDRTGSAGDCRVLPVD